VSRTILNRDWASYKGCSGRWTIPSLSVGMTAMPCTQTCAACLFTGEPQPFHLITCGSQHCPSGKHHAVAVCIEDVKKQRNAIPSSSNSHSTQLPQQNVSLFCRKGAVWWHAVHREQSKLYVHHSAAMLEMVWLPAVVCGFFLCVTLIYVLSMGQEGPNMYHLKKP